MTINGVNAEAHWHRHKHEAGSTLVLNGGDEATMTALVAASALARDGACALCGKARMSWIKKSVRRTVLHNMTPYEVCAGHVEEVTSPVRKASRAEEMYVPTADRAMIVRKYKEGVAASIIATWFRTFLKKKEGAMARAATIVTRRARQFLITRRETRRQVEKGGLILQEVVVGLNNRKIKRAFGEWKTATPFVYLLKTVGGHVFNLPDEIVQQTVTNRVAFVDFTLSMYSTGFDHPGDNTLPSDALAQLQELDILSLMFGRTTLLTKKGELPKDCMTRLGAKSDLHGATNFTNIVQRIHDLISQGVIISEVIVLTDGVGLLKELRLGQLSCIKRFMVILYDDKVGQATRPVQCTDMAAMLNVDATVTFHVIHRKSARERFYDREELTACIESLKEASTVSITTPGVVTTGRICGCTSPFDVLDANGSKFRVIDTGEEAPRAMIEEFARSAAGQNESVMTKVIRICGPDYQWLRAVQLGEYTNDLDAVVDVRLQAEINKAFMATHKSL